MVGEIRGRREQPARRALFQCAGEAFGFFVGMAFLKGKLDLRFVCCTVGQYVSAAKRQYLRAVILEEHVRSGVGYV